MQYGRDNRTAVATTLAPAVSTSFMQSTHLSSPDMAARHSERSSGGIVASAAALSSTDMAARASDRLSALAASFTAALAFALSASCAAALSFAAFFLMRSASAFSKASRSFAAFFLMRSASAFSKASRKLWKVLIIRGRILIWSFSLWLALGSWDLHNNVQRTVYTLPSIHTAQYTVSIVVCLMEAACRPHGSRQNHCTSSSGSRRRRR